jgi:hypothetical protein
LLAQEEEPVRQWIRALSEWETANDE